LRPCLQGRDLLVRVVAINLGGCHETPIDCRTGILATNTAAILGLGDFMPVTGRRRTVAGRPVD
jgi:hypothetical protein